MNRDARTVFGEKCVESIMCIVSLSALINKTDSKRRKKVKSIVRISLNRERQKIHLRMEMNRKRKGEKKRFRHHDFSGWGSF